MRTKVYSQAMLDISQLTPADIHIDDIARSLSMTCRFNGHVSEFYSVAQHSVYVAYCFPIVLERNTQGGITDEIWCRAAMTGLLHDASEAYVGDLINPIKVEMPEFQRLERRITDTIFEAFGLTTSMLDLVTEVDRAIVVNEMNRLYSTGAHAELRARYGDGVMNIEIDPVGPAEAERRFLQTFSDLSRRMGRSVYNA